MFSREDVMIGDNDDLVRVPNTRILAKMLLKNANGARPAHIVCHEHVDIDPDVLAGLHLLPPGLGGQDLRSYRHGLGHRSCSLAGLGDDCSGMGVP